MSQSTKCQCVELSHSDKVKLIKDPDKSVISIAVTENH